MPKVASDFFTMAPETTRLTPSAEMKRLTDAHCRVTPTPRAPSTHFQQAGQARWAPTAQSSASVEARGRRRSCPSSWLLLARGTSHRPLQVRAQVHRGDVRGVAPFRQRLEATHHHEGRELPRSAHQLQEGEGLRVEPVHWLELVARQRLLEVEQQVCAARSSPTGLSPRSSAHPFPKTVRLKQTRSTARLPVGAVSGRGAQG
eukprot:COSAG01_NODE_8021_length_2950_cov_7.546826_3_plen_203_part_01